MLCDSDRQTEALLRETIKKGQSSGEITNSQDAASIASFIFNIIKGMRVTARSGVDRKTFDGVVALIKLVLQFVVRINHKGHKGSTKATKPVALPVDTTNIVD